MKNIMNSLGIDSIPVFFAEIRNAGMIKGKLLQGLPSSYTLLQSEISYEKSRQHKSG